MLCCSPRSRASGDLVPPGIQKRGDNDHELRVIIWEARAIATNAKAGTSDVFVSVQPQGKMDYDEQQTDVHYMSKGDAEFQWRMVWGMPQTEKAAKLYIQVGDYDKIGANEMIGEAEFDLAPICERLKKRGKGQFIDTWVTCTSPKAEGPRARVCLTVELLKLDEAALKPAGKGRDTPNANPRLVAPIRMKPFKPSCPCM